MYVADNANEVVDRYSESGEYQAQLGGSEAFSYIAALAVNASGEVYVADGGNHTVDIYSAPHEIVNEPQWVTEAASSVGVTMATLKGTVNPEGGAVTACEFDRHRNFYGHPEPCEQSKATSAKAPQGGGRADLTGWNRYHCHYRLTGTGQRAGTRQRKRLASPATPRPLQGSHRQPQLRRYIRDVSSRSQPPRSTDRLPFRILHRRGPLDSARQQSAGNGPSAVHVHPERDPD